MKKATTKQHPFDKALEIPVDPQRKPKGAKQDAFDKALEFPVEYCQF